MSLSTSCQIIGGQQDQEAAVLKDSNTIPFRSDTQNVASLQLDSLTQNIFVPVLKKLQLLAGHSSITQIIQCQATHKQATQHLKQLNARQIKEALLVSIENDLILFKKDHQQSSEEMSDSFDGEKKKNYEDLQKLWFQYLENLVVKISTYLRKKWTQKEIYQTISFKWTPSVLMLIHKEPTIHGIQVPFQQNYLENKAEIRINQQNSSLSRPWNQSRIYDLIKQVQNSETATRLYLAFHHLLSSLAQKQSQLAACLDSNDQLEVLINNQITLIADQQQEQENYKNQLLTNQQQLDKLAERCKVLQTELSGVLKNFDSLKEEQYQSQKGYYVNPLFDKSKLQEKYMTEIIQLQSDLYMEKGQVKTLVDLFIDQTKKTHHAFFDLGANSYFVSKYDKDLHKKIRYLKPFDGINLEELLSLKEEEDMTECTHQMHRSTISVFSSIELDGIMRNLGEESESFEDQTA